MGPIRAASDWSHVRMIDCSGKGVAQMDRFLKDFIGSTETDLETDRGKSHGDFKHLGFISRIQKRRPPGMPSCVLDSKHSRDAVRSATARPNARRTRLLNPVWVPPCKILVTV